MLHIALLVIVVVVLSLSFAGGGLRAAEPVKAKQGITQVREADTTAGLTRDQIRVRLADLASRKPPGKLVMGAMCYKPAGPPGRIEYSCPECGEKTLYTSDRSKKGRFQTMWFLHRDLANCRRVAAQIKEVAVSLDEREFCAKCAPHADQPKLSLIVRHAGARTAHRVDGVSLDDLNLIHEFLTGKSKHVGRQDRETPLKNHLQRLEQLLAVTVVDKE